MANNWQEHERRVQMLRGILNAKPVEAARFPKWFTELVKQSRKRRGLKAKDCPLSTQWLVYHNLPLATGIPNVCECLDHWGKSGDLFVSEPYTRRDQLEVAFKLADALGCDVTIDPKSWHNPGQTTRIEFREREGSR